MRLMFVPLLLLLACDPSGSAAAPKQGSRTGEGGEVASGSGGQPTTAAPTPASAAPPAAPVNAFVLVSGVVVPGRLLATSPGDGSMARLAGSRLVLYDENGKVCQATVGPPQMVPRRCSVHPPLAPAPAPTSAAELVDYDGDCRGAMYGLAPGASFATIKVRAASEGLEKVAEGVFDETTGRMASEKAQLEGLPEAAEVISTRVLSGKGLTSLALLYARVHGERRISAYEVSGPDEAPVIEGMWGMRAPAPSRVVGGDVDRDGKVDAIISHARGIGVILTGGGDGYLTCE